MEQLIKPLRSPGTGNPKTPKANVMKARIIMALIIAVSMASWITVPENEPVKAKDSVCKMAPMPVVKKPAKKGIKLLFESVLYHFM